MRRSEIIDFFKSEGKVRFDELTEPKFNYPGDFDERKLMRFLELAGLSKSTNIETILANLGVAEKQEGRLYFNNAGVLFFAKEPQRFIPWSVFTVALFKDEEGIDVIDRKEIGGSLFEIVEQVMSFVKLYSKVAYRFTGSAQREEVYEYPFEAIREAIINSVMHKYYFEHGHNNILRFLPDKIKIENFWLKPQHFILGETVFRRNHLIVDLFSRIHFGEKMGTGINRMRNICKKENAPYPEIIFNENYFYITFAPSRTYIELKGTEKVTEVTRGRKKLLDAINDVLTDTINEGIRDRIIDGINEAIKNRLTIVLLHILNKGFITRRAAEKVCNISQPTAERDISLLRRLQLIEFKGARKTGKYVLTEKGKKIIEDSMK